MQGYGYMKCFSYFGSIFLEINDVFQTENTLYIYTILKDISLLNYAIRSLAILIVNRMLKKLKPSKMRFFIKYSKKSIFFFCEVFS